MNVDGNNVRNGSDLQVNVSQPRTRDTAVGFDALNMTMENETNFEINTTHSTDSVGGSDAEDYATNGNEIVQYVRLNHSVDASKTFGGTGVDYRVKKSALPAGASPGEVTLRRYNTDDDEWNTMLATLEGESATHYYYSSDTPGFSQFAITAPTQSTNSGSPPADTGGSSSGGDSTEDARFVVIDLAVPTRAVTIGDTLDMHATVGNVGDEAGEFVFAVRKDGEAVSRSVVSIAGGETKTTTLSPVFETAGEYSVVVDGETVETILASENGTETPTPIPETPDQPTTDATDKPTTTSATATQPEGTTRESPGTTPGEDSSGMLWLAVLGALVVGGLLVALMVYRNRDEEEADSEADAEPDDEGE